MKLKAVLKETKIDEFLYGKELTEKLKEAKALNKMGESMKIPNKASTSKQALNARTPFARRLPITQMGSTSFGGRLKRKPFFKNRQQFINHRAQSQGSQRALMPKQDKKN